MSKPISGEKHEYAKHLRKYGKRRVAKVERRANKTTIRKQEQD